MKEGWRDRSNLQSLGEKGLSPKHFQLIWVSSIFIDIYCLGFMFDMFDGNAQVYLRVECVLDCRSTWSWIDIGTLGPKTRPLGLRFCERTEPNYYNWASPCHSKLGNGFVLTTKTWKTYDPTAITIAGTVSPTIGCMRNRGPTSWLLAQPGASFPVILSKDIVKIRADILAFFR